MSRYILIAYKPDSDYGSCAGCILDSYASDLIIEEIDNEDDIISRIAELKAMELRRGETGYYITLFEDGVRIIDDDGYIENDHETFYDRIDILTKKLVSERNEIKRLKEEKERVALEERRKQKRLEEFLTLKKEFGE